MKRALILSLFPLLLWRGAALAQDAGANAAAAVAAREAAEERYNRMAADLQAVQTDNTVLHNKLNSLEQEVQSLRDAQAKPVDNSAVQDQLKRLADKIQEVDQKRLADKDAISEEIRKAMHNIESAAAPVEPRPRRHPTAPVDNTAVTPGPAPADGGYSYTVVEGDTLGAIVKAYNLEYKSKGMKPITMKQTREANPGVNWDRLKVGQKIVVPKPAGS